MAIEKESGSLDWETRCLEGCLLIREHGNGNTGDRACV